MRSFNSVATTTARTEKCSNQSVSGERSDQYKNLVGGNHRIRQHAPFVHLQFMKNNSISLRKEFFNACERATKNMSNGWPRWRSDDHESKWRTQPWKDESAIVNLVDVNEVGTHWVWYKKRDGSVRCFDGYGNLPPPIDLVGVLYNYECKQQSKTVICGTFMFILVNVTLSVNDTMSSLTVTMTVTNLAAPACGFSLLSSSERVIDTWVCWILPPITQYRTWS